MLAFWRRGYEGTSMADLVQALGIASARIYAAFGSKQDLFDEAVQWTVPVDELTTADPAQTARLRGQAEDIASGFDNPALSAAMRQLALNILSRRDINDRKANP